MNNYIYFFNFRKMNICVTRFSNTTFNENLNFKKKNNIIGSLYGSPIKITDKILLDEKILIVEMNNTTNIIEGIGIIKNRYLQEPKKLYKIYNDNNYNRFIYKSNFRIDKNNFTNYEKNNIKKLEELLFYSYKHFKRGKGIQQIPSFIKKNEEFNYTKFIEDIYLSRFVNLNLKHIKIIK